MIGLEDGWFDIDFIVNEFITAGTSGECVICSTVLVTLLLIGAKHVDQELKTQLVASIGVVLFLYYKLSMCYTCSTVKLHNTFLFKVFKIIFLWFPGNRTKTYSRCTAKRKATKMALWRIIKDLCRLSGKKW